MKTLTIAAASLALAAGVSRSESSQAAAAVDTAAIAKTIEADVARIVAGINAHNPAAAAAYDAPDIVSMECGSSPVVGIKADREGFKSLVRDPFWKVSLIHKTVDVASSGDLAVYRGVYDEDHGRAGVLMTHKTNFIAEFRRASDGPWKMAWYITAKMEQSHPK